MAASDRMRCWWVAIGCVVLLAGPARAGEDSRWRNTLKFGYVRTTGNTDTQTFSLREESSLDLSPDRYFLKGEGLFAEDDSRTTASHWFLGLRYERVFRERWFGLLTARYLKDTFAGYDTRLSGGPGLGCEVIKTERHYLKAMASALYVYENYAAAEEGSDTYPSGSVAGEYRWEILANLRFKQTGEYQVNLEETDAYFVSSETSLEAKVNDLVALEVAYILAYQGSPPDGTDSTDAKFLTTLNVSYDPW